MADVSKRVSKHTSESHRPKTGPADGVPPEHAVPTISLASPRGGRALKTRAAQEKLDPMGKPEQPEPWYKLDPEEAIDPWNDFDEPELPPGIPLTIGPAPGGPAGPASGVDLETGRMAAVLNWTVSQTDHRQKVIRVSDAIVRLKRACHY